MIDTFENLNKEKQNRILNAVMEEFSLKGYKQATTDEIVVRAGISKGALFHYFGSKKKLYEYLIVFVIDTYTSSIYEKIDFHEPDFFARLRQVMKAKLEVSIEYPAFVSFWERASLESRKTVDMQYRNKFPRATHERQDFFSNVDFSRFKDDLDLPRTLNIIFWTFDQFAKEMVQRAISEKESLDWIREYGEAEKYLNYFQKLFYKEPIDDISVK